MSQSPPNRPAPNSLLVPIGGTGPFWGLLARYGVLISCHFFFSMVPVPYVGSWITQLAYQGLELSRKLLAPTDVELAKMFAWWVLPMFVAALWLLLDRKRKHDVVIMEVGRLLARYGLAVTMCAYGFEKIFAAQGSSAYEMNRMLRAFGESGGQTTLMAWLGHSTIYEEFAGWVEVGGGVLLAFRRTATLGALTELAAMVNVFIVNAGHWDLGLGFTPLSFLNIPIFLLLPEAVRMARAFSGRAADPAVYAYLTPPKWWTYLANATHACMVAWLYLTNTFTSHAVALAFSYRSPVRGVYTVERFERNGREEVLAFENPNRWREVAIEAFRGEMTVQTVDRTEFELRAAWDMSDSKGPRKDVADEYQERLATASQPEGDWTYGTYSTERIIMGHGDEPSAPGSLHYRRAPNNDLTLSGVIRGDTLKVELRRMALDSLPFYQYRWYVSEWRASIAIWVRRLGWTR